MEKDKPIKVAHVLNSVGGVDVYLRVTLPALNPSVVTPVIIHGDSDTTTPFKDKNGNELNEYIIPLQRAIAPIKDIIAVVKAVKILKQEKPDLIHAHSAKGGIIARIASCFYPVTVLYTPHGFSYLSASARFKRMIFLNIEKVFKHFRSVLLAVSNSERNRAIKDVGYSGERAHTFNNCIEPILKENLKSPELDLPDDFICTVGRPSFQKNIEMMIEVLRELKKKKPDIHLVIMGVGEYSPNKENVEQLVKTYGLLENTTMIPWIERERIFEIINKSKLYISAARYEGLPYSIIEAIALGKACVVTNCDGNRDLVKDGFNGYVIEENSVDSMAKRIFELLNNETQRASFERNSLMFFNEHFNIRNNIQDLEHIYIKYAKN